MRVLVYGMVGTNRGGIENFLLEMNGYMSNDIIFDYVIEEDTCIYLDKITSRGGNVYHVTPRKKNPIRNIIDNYKLLKKMSCTIDIAYFNISSLSWILPERIAIFLGYKVFVHAHNAEFINANSGMIYRIVNRINRIWMSGWKICRLTCSKPSTEFMYQKHDDVKMIYNAIDIDKFKYDGNKRDIMRSRIGINDKFVIGFVGRLSYQKNPLYLIEILKQVIADYPDVVLLIIGDGNMRAKMEEEIKESGLTDNCILLGNCDNVNELLLVMDVLILPSRHEGLPYVVVEAQSSGLYCLVSNLVTKEINVTDRVAFLPIGKDNASMWKSEIKRCMYTTNTNREKYAETMKQTNFNIKNESKRLEKILTGK